MPMLMCRQPDNPGRYRFPEICYVHGFMGGEVLETDGLSASLVTVV